MIYYTTMMKCGVSVGTGTLLKERMKSMKKLKSILTCFFLVVCMVTVTACGQQASEKQGEDKEKEASGKDSLITVGFALSGSAAGWSGALIQSVKDNCTEENGINLLFEDADGDFDTQVELIRSFIEQKVDAIGFTPIVSDGWDEVLKEAKDAGIPVIMLDRTINTSDDTLYTSWVGSDFLLEGYKGADWLIDYMKENYTGKDKIKVAIFQGTVGASAEVGRTQGIEEMLGAEGNYDIVYKADGDFNHDGGVNNMQAVLDQGLDIDVLVAENDDMALGAIEVMEENGIKPGKDIVILSFDATTPGFEAMIEGKINCDMECNPLSGGIFVDLIKKTLNGDPVEKKTYVQEQLFPADTAADYIDGRKY